MLKSLKLLFKKINDTLNNFRVIKGGFCRFEQSLQIFFKKLPANPSNFRLKLAKYLYFIFT